MNKNNYYFIVPAICLTLVFATAFLCNQCGFNADGTNDEVIETEAEGDSNGDGNDNDGPKKKIPTVNLEIIKGPTYSEDNDVCFYRVKAEVSGSPAPDIKFSKDDSNGAWGGGRCCPG